MAAEVGICLERLTQHRVAQRHGDEIGWRDVAQIFERPGEQLGGGLAVVDPYRAASGDRVVEVEVARHDVTERHCFENLWRIVAELEQSERAILRDGDVEIGVRLRRRLGGSGRTRRIDDPRDMLGADRVHPLGHLMAWRCRDDFGPGCDGEPLDRSRRRDNRHPERRERAQRSGVACRVVYDDDLRADHRDALAELGMISRHQRIGDADGRDCCAAPLDADGGNAMFDRRLGQKGYNVADTDPPRKCCAMRRSRRAGA